MGYWYTLRRAPNQASEPTGRMRAWLKEDWSDPDRKRKLAWGNSPEPQPEFVEYLGAKTNGIRDFPIYRQIKPDEPFATIEEATAAATEHAGAMWDDCRDGEKLRKNPDYRMEVFVSILDENQKLVHRGRIIGAPCQSTDELIRRDTKARDKKRRIREIRSE
jgi:hypothetical protein